MKRRWACALLLGSVAALPTQAKICALDNPPAATLLLPYFEVDLAGPGGRTTLFSIDNAGPEARLAHVVLWTDIAVPTLAFVAGNANVLWGDYYYVQAGNTALAQAGNLVRLEADASLVNSSHTFYNALLHSTDNAADGREPLPTTWAVRFLAGGGFRGSTDLITWRDQRDPASPFVCGHNRPLLEGQRLVVAFDEEENPSVVASDCFPGKSCDPASTLRLDAANRVTVGSSRLPVPYDFGWLFLDLNQPQLPLSPFVPTAASWVGTVMSSQGLFSVGIPGTPLDNGCAPFTGATDPVQPAAGNR